MKLSGEHVKRIHAALLNGYDLSTLRMMVRMELDLNLSAIAGGDNTSIVMFNLIDWAERNGKVLTLIAGAHTHNQANKLLAALAQEAPGWPEFAQTAPVSPVAAGNAAPNWQKAGIDLVLIRAGDFLYGDDKKRVHLDPFRIGRTPVTNRQYEVFIDATGHAVPKHWENGRIPSGKEDHPVVYVTWDDAKAFCSWAGVFLPTEHQWEKAARGTDGRKYPWSNQPPTTQLCNFGENVYNTTPVGLYSPQGDSPYGVVDMAGNVWEWCDGWYDTEGKYRPLRGGAWNCYDVIVRCAVRVRLVPRSWFNGVGFRVVSPGF